MPEAQRSTPQRRPRSGSRPRAASAASGGLPVLEFVLANYTNFNARATRDALVAYWRHIEGGGKMFWAVAGAMSSAQLGITLAPAIRAGLIHGLSVTGANLEESLFRLVAHHSYQDFPDYRYFRKQDDAKILADRMRRVTDTSIPEDEAFRVVEKIIVPTWKRATAGGERRFWHEYFYELIQAIDEKTYEGIRRWYTYPKSPKMNAHAERFNRTLQESFVDYHEDLLFTDLALFNRKLADWLVFYNTERPHHALGQQSPLSFLIQHQPECQRWWTHTRH